MIWIIALITPKVPPPRESFKLAEWIGNVTTSTSVRAERFALSPCHLPNLDIDSQAAPTCGKASIYSRSTSFGHPSGILRTFSVMPSRCPCHIYEVLKYYSDEDYPKHKRSPRCNSRGGFGEGRCGGLLGSTSRLTLLERAKEITRQDSAPMPAWSGMHSW